MRRTAGRFQLRILAGRDQPETLAVAVIEHQGADQQLQPERRVTCALHVGRVQPPAQVGQRRVQHGDQHVLLAGVVW